MAQSRLRLVFAKHSPLIYTSHLDLQRTWERALRRARAPLAYSHGFNPRPRLQLAAALPLGHAGEAELLDLWLEQPLEPLALASVLAEVTPPGLIVREVLGVDPAAPPLQTQVDAADYAVEVEGHVPDLDRRVAALLSAAQLPRQRRERAYDLRPLVEALSVVDAVPGWSGLQMRLAARGGATGRPEEVVDALGLGGRYARYQRLRLLDAAGRPLHWSS